MRQSWLAYQVRRSVRLWGQHVESRLHEVEYVEYDPPKKPMKPEAVYDLASALHLSYAENVYGSERDLPQPTDVDLGELLAKMNDSPPVA